MCVYAFVVCLNLFIAKSEWAKNAPNSFLKITWFSQFMMIFHCSHTRNYIVHALKWTLELKFRRGSEKSKKNHFAKLIQLKRDVPLKNIVTQMSKNIACVIIWRLIRQIFVKRKILVVKKSYFESFFFKLRSKIQIKKYDSYPVWT